MVYIYITAPQRPLVIQNQRISNEHFEPKVYWSERYLERPREEAVGRSTNRPENFRVFEAAKRNVYWKMHQTELGLVKNHDCPSHLAEMELY